MLFGGFGTAAPSGGTATTQAYGYDNDGNLTSDNGVTYTYDARDELVSSSNGDGYTYSADGDMTGETSGSGTTADSFDAYGQQVTAGTQQYTWDGLNRVVTAGTTANAGTGEAITYEGLTNEVASDSSASYSRDPSGAITGVDSGAGGRTLALSSQHDDLVGLFTAGGSSMSGSSTYSPWGQVLGSAGPSVQVGFQGQWTDPATGQVSMGSRSCRPAAGGFAGRDTAGSPGGAAVTDNAFAYGDDNPVTVMDPSGMRRRRPRRGSAERALAPCRANVKAGHPVTGCPAFRLVAERRSVLLGYQECQ